MQGYLKVIVLLWLFTGFLNTGIASTATDTTLKAVDQSIRMRQYEQAVKLLNPLLMENNATAQYRMAGLYRVGKGVKQDSDKARELYEKAALNGHAEAQYALASMLEKQGSQGEQARYWFQASAFEGYAPAIRKLEDLENKNNILKIDKATIFDAIRHNKIDTIKQWLDSNQNLNIQDGSQRSPLLVALLSGHEDMSLLLLTHSKQFDTADENRTRPIHVATRQGFRNIVEKLLSRKININAQDLLGNTALIIAVNNNDRQLIDILLKHKANPRIQNKKQLSAIDLARSSNHLDLFKKSGIDTTELTTKSTAIDLKAFEKTVRSSTSLYSGWPILSIASHLGEEALVQQLLAKNTNVNATDSSGFTALHRAAANGQLSITKQLIARGAIVNATNKRKETPLFLAAVSGQYKILQFLLKNSAKTTLLTANKSSALSVAIRNQHTKSATLLLNKPLDEQSRKQALLIAIENKMESVAIELSKGNPLLSKADDKQRTVLWLATEAGLRKLVATLLRDGKIVKTIDQIDKLGYTALARATLGNHRSIVKMLIDHGANTRTVTQEGNTLLMLAVISGHVKLSEYYIRTDADIDHRNLAGDTAVMLAAANGQNDVIELLLKVGADLQRRNHDDLNAYQIALDAGHEETAALIKSRSGTLFNLFN